MKRCKLFILCCLMIIAAAGNGNAEESKPKPKEWQIKGALAAWKDEILSIKAMALNKLVEFDSINLISNEIDTIVELLKNDDESVRGASANALGKINNVSQEVIRKIAFLLDDKDSDIRKSAVSGLGEIGKIDSETIKKIIFLLEDKDLDVRNAVIKTLGKIQKIQPEHIQSIIKLLEHKNSEIKISAISALGEIRETSSGAIKKIIDFSNDKDFDTRKSAIMALGKIGKFKPDVISNIVVFLEDPNSAIRKSAIAALSEIGDKASSELVKRITELLDDKDNGIRNIALKTLEIIGNIPTQSLNKIIMMLEGKKCYNDLSCYVCIVNILEKIQNIPKDSVQKILALLDDNDISIQSMAIKILCNINNLPPEDVKKIMNIVDRRLSEHNQSHFDIDNIIRSTVKMPNISQDIIEKITSLINHNAVWVTFDVVESINKIGKLSSKVIQLFTLRLASEKKEKGYMYGSDDMVKDTILKLNPIDKLNIQDMLYILCPIYSNSQYKSLRFLAHFTGGGKEDVEILLKWLGEPEKNKPQKLDHDLAIKTLKIFSEVWEASKPYKKLNEDLAQQIATVISMKDIRWTPEDLDILKAHETHLKDFPQAQSVSNVISAIEAQMVFWKYAKRFGIFFVVHIGFWIILIFIYPKSRMVQAEFFWNEWIRKWTLGFVYIHFVLKWIPFLRKKLFEPFKDTLLADANIAEFEHESYFPDSDVEHAGKRQPVFQAIPGIRGQIVLQGESGLGKSLYLRKLVRDAKGVAVYLRAERCAKGVLEAIQAKLEGIAKDTEFLKHLIYAGALDICIDGLNEVSPDTRAKVSEFAESNFKGNIIMATQPIEWEPPSIAKTYILKPLRDDQIEAFLISREQTFSQDAKVRGQAYQQACKDYLATALCQTQCGEETETARRMLSNPMDLSIVGQMIGHGQSPNVFRLYEQWFEKMSEKYQEKHLNTFPIAAFSERVYQQRLSDNTEVPYQDFAKESECLEDFKMALRRQSQNKETWHFRHDKIMEYFIALTFEKNENRLIDNISDPRFRGVYFMLATLMPDDAAMSLREELIQYAARTKDHTVSDTFVQLMRSRKQGNP